MLTPPTEAVAAVLGKAGEFDGLWRHPGKSVNMFDLREQCADFAISRPVAEAALADLRTMEEADREAGWSAGSFSGNLHHLKLAAVAAVRLNLGLCSGASVIQGQGRDSGAGPADGSGRRAGRPTS